LHPRLLHRCTALALVAAAGCSRTAQGPAASSVAMQAASGSLGPAALEWSGKFKSTQQQSTGVEMRQLNVATGTVTLTAPNDRQTRVQITVSGPVEASAELRWAIAPGACRSGAIPLMPPTSFPDIRMANGRGQLDETISLSIPTSGSYHVNIYSGSVTDETGVITCAELKLSQRHEAR
jgi:hypothetical protein